MTRTVVSPVPTDGNGTGVAAVTHTSSETVFYEDDVCVSVCVRPPTSISDGTTGNLMCAPARTCVIEEAYDMVDKFINHYRHRSIRTQGTYFRVLRRLFKLFIANGLSCDPNIIGEDEVNYVLAMNLTDGTKRHYVATLKQYSEIMSDKYNPNITIKRMKIRYDINNENRKTIEYEDYLRIIKSAEEPWIRITLMLGGELGLRRRELVNLNVQDVNDGWLTVVKGKGNKTSKVPLSKAMMHELDEWMQYRERIIHSYSKNEAGDALIAIPFKRLNKVIRLPYDSVYRWMKRLTDEAGCTTSPHALRSMYITNRLDSGVPLHITKELARHVDVKLTASYYRPRDNILAMMQEVPVNRADPLKNAELVKADVSKYI